MRIFARPTHPMQYCGSFFFGQEIGRILKCFPALASRHTDDTDLRARHAATNFKITGRIPRHFALRVAAVAGLALRFAAVADAGIAAAPPTALLVPHLDSVHNMCCAEYEGVRLSV